MKKIERRAVVVCDTGRGINSEDIQQLTEIINRIILFIPNVIIAMAIIVIGSLIARFLSALARSSVSELGVGSPNLTQGTVNSPIVVLFID